MKSLDRKRIVEVSGHFRAVQTMGNSYCMLANKTHKKICILTFNQADLMYACKSVAIHFIPIRLVFMIPMLIKTV